MSKIICPHCGAENPKSPIVTSCQECLESLEGARPAPEPADVLPPPDPLATSPAAAAGELTETPPARPEPGPSWRDDVASLTAQGEKIQAIKLYREHTGAGLKQAKEAVEALASGQPQPAEPAGDPSHDPEIMRLLQRGEKIEAIKRYRELVPVGLREAKEAVDVMEVAAGPSAATIGSSVESEIVSLLEQGQWIPAIKLYREHTGASLKVAKYAVAARARERGIPEPAAPGCLGGLFLGLALLIAAVVTHSG